MTRRPARLHPVLAVAAALLLGACSASDMESSDSGGMPPSGGQTEYDSGEDSADVDTGGGDGTIDLPAFTPQEGRSLIVRMDVGLEVASVADAVEGLIRLAERHDGQLANSRVDVSSPEYSSGELVFRMPPAEVDPFIDDLDPEVGRTVSLNGSTEDVTGQIRDLDAQIEAAEISVDRVRTLLEGATKLADVILLEGELTTRQTTLEQLRAMKADLGQQVALATVTVYLSTAPADVDDSDGVVDSIGDAFATGWDAFLAALVGLLVLLGWTIPFIVALGIVAALTITIIRTVRRRRPTPTAPPIPSE
ncbi:MAG: DUF4349 domain-containing protein [Ilumatobacteraceae bacterium]